MTNIEKIARILASVAVRNDIDVLRSERKKMIENNWRKYIKEAKNLLLTIREPSIAMTIAFHNQFDRPSGVLAENVWSALIDVSVMELPK